METLDLIKLLIEGGVAAILGVGLVVVWRTWRSCEKDHKKELVAQAAQYKETIEYKNSVIEQLADQIENVSKQANTRLDRMIQMIADGGVGTQSVLSDNAAAMATNQLAIQDMKTELQQLRQSIDRILRGGG